MKWFKRRPDLTSDLRRRIGEDVARRLAATPGVERVEAPSVLMFVRPDFLPPAECARLVRMIDARRRPSTLLSGTDPAAGIRTSESCDMERWSPEVQPIDESIAALLGIDPPHGETMQGQRYGPGQQFRAHHDYFLPSEPYWADMLAQGGQRTWTAMIYLSDVGEGGATWFPEAGIRIAPRRGLLLAWNNLNADGSPNGKTLHEGMPVLRGTKYIVTKWFRESRWNPPGLLDSAAEAATDKE